ncbi:MAG: hypothetical protein SWQ30_13575 [Thermodesulfobacteriota bacterium]|nr:hypothetical protein [Thermodesulfobacteriota bacterium]
MEERENCARFHMDMQPIDMEIRGKRCGQTKIMEGRRYYGVQGRSAKGARFSPILGALLLHDLNTHDRIELMEQARYPQPLGNAEYPRP